MDNLCFMTASCGNVALFMCQAELLRIEHETVSVDEYLHELFFQAQGP